MSVDNLLEDYALEEDCAKAWNIDKRTLARYRNEPGGLPFMKLGGRVYIHLPGAREWVKRRTIRRNAVSSIKSR